MKIRIICLGLCFFGQLLWGKLPADTHQLVLVITPSWQSSTGYLFKLQKGPRGWHIVHPKPYPVSLGRNGLAWGRGKFIMPETQNLKKEGDGKAPAGLFLLRPRLYGYASEPFGDINWPYTQLTQEWYGIDDPASRYYNRIVNIKHIQKTDWKSCETMRRRDHLYRWLLVIEHNTERTIPGAGSCIFLHLWRKPGAPTAGCTALSEENFMALLRWLQASTHPYWLQLPLTEYPLYRRKYNLPELNWEGVK